MQDLLQNNGHQEVTFLRPCEVGSLIWVERRSVWSSHVLPEDQFLARGLLVNDSGLLQATLVPS